MGFAPPGVGFSGGSTTWEQSSSVLQIGAVVFLDEEHPNTIEFPKPQTLSVHVNIGGARVIQELGPNPGDVEWEGVLFDQNVETRLDQLEAMKVAAQPVILSYLDQKYRVVIRDFKRKYSHEYLGGYRIIVTVQDDLTAGATSPAPPSVTSQVNGLTTSASNAIAQAAANDATGTAALVAAYNAMLLVLEAAGDITTLTGSSLTTVTNAVNAATSAASSYLATLPANGSNTQFVLASQIVNYLTVIGKNIAQAQAPFAVIKQTSSLWALAVQGYKADPSVAFDIARSNGYISPLMPKNQEFRVILPPLQTASS